MTSVNSLSADSFSVEKHDLMAINTRKVKILNDEGPSVTKDTEMLPSSRMCRVVLKLHLMECYTKLKS